jgi:flagellar hook assembly protein FlgD
MGRRVRTIFSGRLQPGTTQFAWDGRHDNGSRATSGIYFYRLEMRGRVLSRRIVLLRAQ